MDRAGQAGSILTEQLGLSSQIRLPSSLDQIASRGAGSEEAVATASQDDHDPLIRCLKGGTLPAFRQPEQTTDILRSDFPDACSETISRADRICDGTFDLLGYRGLSFGDPIDWHLDPVSGVRAPERHWSRIRYLDASSVGDHKVVWELNRHQYFATLGKAYWLTGDKKYPETFCQHLDSWMRANPPKLGINWASSLEVAFRAISWLWGLHFFRRSRRLDDSLRGRVLKYLYLFGRHLETYPSTYFSPNTHLTGEALGLLYLGSQLRGLDRAPDWRSQAIEILEKEVKRQLTGDGVYFERSTHYHRYTADFLAHAIVLSRCTDLKLPSAIPEALERLLEHLMYISQPDGTAPHIGDDDGGRLLFLDHRPPEDVRSSLAVGAALFSRVDFRSVAGDPSEEIVWLCGPEELDRFCRLPLADPYPPSRAFSEGGVFVFRDDWTSTADVMTLTSESRLNYTGAHAHADTFSITLSWNGRPFIVDPGTYCYDSRSPWRQRLRSTRAHNTVSVEGRSSSVAEGPFGWSSRPSVFCEHWISEPRFNFYDGSHDGYGRIRSGLRHRRSVLDLKEDYWVICDRVTGADDGTLSMAAHFHFDPDVEVQRHGQDVLCRRKDGSSLHVAIDGADELRIDDEEVHSSVYGVLEPSSSLRALGRVGSERRILTLLLPAALSGAPNLRSIEFQPYGARISNDRWEDLLFHAVPSGTAWESVETDFEWAWLRRDLRTGQLREYILLFGSHLSYKDETIFHADAKVRSAHGRTRDSRLVVRAGSAPPNQIDGLHRSGTAEVWLGPLGEGACGGHTIRECSRPRTTQETLSNGGGD